MASIGRGNLKCKQCGKPRPYWSDYCRKHRIAYGQATSAELEQASEIVSRAAKPDTADLITTATGALKLAEDAEAFLREL